MMPVQKKNPRSAFTLIELMMVAVIMLMVSGIVYSFYTNLVRVYFKGSDAMLQITDSQSILDLIGRELKMCSRIVKLSPDYIVFQKYYEVLDSNAPDPVKDLNSIRVKTVHIRLVEDDEGFFRFERKEGLDTFETFHPTFRAKNVSKNFFMAWVYDKYGKLQLYDEKRYKANRIPLVELRMDIDSAANPLCLIKKVFLPVPYGALPKFEIPEINE
jgi:prepilin-type N-terminal cleavage/methylation domain-containing protein